jgi:hypothetical protein
VTILSIFIMALAGAASAYSSTYQATIHASSANPTIDGQYAPDADWAAAGATTFGTNGVFRQEWTSSPSYYSCFLIETSDNTNDAGDYWEICWDSTSAGSTTPPNGGSAPQTDDYKLTVTGHDSPAVQWYKGTGTTWTAISQPASFSTPTTFIQAQSLSSTPSISAAHYIWEMKIDKLNTDLGTVPMGYNWAQYVAYYDAHTGGNGLQAWPPTPASDTNPDSWGYVPYSSDPVPESLSLLAVIVLSSFAVVAGTIVIRKRKK